MPKRLVFLFAVLIFGLVLSGCGLFNDVDLNDDETVEEQSIADFFNSFVNSFGVLVQEFVDETEEAEGALDFPDADDLDFSDFLGHFDEFLDGPGGRDEEEAKVDIIEELEDFVLDIESAFDIDRAEFNDTNIEVAFQYKYFIEVPFFEVFDEEQEYPQEELRLFLFMVEVSITVEEEEEEDFRMIESIVVEYDDGFRVLDADFFYLLYIPAG